MNRKEIRDRILLALNDSTTEPQFWTLDEMNDIIQDGYEVLAEEIEAYKRTTYFVKHDGMQFVTLSSIADDIMSPFRLFEDENYRLSVITMQQLDRRRRFWWDDTADRCDFWYPVGWNMFGVYPKVTDGGGWIRCDYLAWPTEPPNDSVELEGYMSDHDALVVYGIYYGLMKQWNVVMAMDYFSQFVARFQDAAIKSDIERLKGRLGVRTMTRENRIGPDPETFRAGMI